GCRFAAWSTGVAWRACQGEGGADLQLDGMPGGARLDFAVNTGQVVLNDRRGGATWAVQQSGQIIDNWADLIVDVLEEEVQQNEDDLTPQIEEAQLPPVAVDDEFGARPGRATMLPVLLNDYDPNADVLVIDGTSGVAEEIGRLDLVTRNQQLQLTLE